MKSLKEQILNLRSEGLSYNDIVEKLGCAKSTVAYYCNSTTKDKQQQVTKKLRKENPIKAKINRFVSNQTSNPLYVKIGSFSVDYRKEEGNKTAKLESRLFSPEDLLEKCGETCYLTGDKIDFSDSSSYNLDHRVPRSKGGESTLENCELATKAANYAKGNLSLEEFFDLCVKVVKHNKLSLD